MATKTMAVTVAAIGGSTFKTAMFSTVNTAFDVAVMRLAKRSRQTVREIAGSLTGQVTEQLAAQITGDADECRVRDPAGEPPQQVVGRDQRHQERERAPDAVRPHLRRRQRIDEELDPVLRAHGTTDGRQHRGQDEDMCDPPPAHEFEHEAHGMVGISAEIARRGVFPDLTRSQQPTICPQKRTSPECSSQKQTTNKTGNRVHPPLLSCVQGRDA